MKSLSVILLAVLLAGGMICAGCTQPVGPGPAPTTTPPTTPKVSVPMTIPHTGDTTFTPVPPETIPEAFATDIGVNVDSVWKIIYIRYNGGKGAILLQRIDATVVTNSGKVIRKSVDNSQGTIPMGYTFEVQGEKGDNRVMVTVTINGVTYSILDETVTFK